MFRTKIVAIDLDGTSLDNNGMLSDRNRRAIENMLARGIKVVPCTGRSLCEIPPEFGKINGLEYMITSNGARIYENGKSIYGKFIPDEQAKEILWILEEFDCVSEICFDGQVYASNVTRDTLAKRGINERYTEFYFSTREVCESLFTIVRANPGKKEKIRAMFPSKEEVNIAAELIRKSFPRLDTIENLNDKSIEITSFGVNKGNALSLLCDCVNVERESVIAIGDSENDISMLNFAHRKFVPANTTREIKALAQMILPSNSENAIEHILKYV